MSTTPSLLAHPGPSHNERVAAAIAHAGTCVAWFLAPLVVYLVERDRSAYVSRQALQALLWSALGTIVSFATCGVAIPLFLAVHVYAAFQALEGRDFEYPLVASVDAKLGVV
ncbi:MAG: DUF4870 domain-containing protein [Labilithrix sp.]|nr:DUF4870 domain-containing protein [Labilithrix sp.]